MQPNSDPRRPDDLPRLYAALACLALVLTATSSQHLGTFAAPTLIAATAVVVALAAAIVVWRRRRVAEPSNVILMRS